MVYPKLNSEHHSRPLTVISMSNAGIPWLANKSSCIEFVFALS